jgi:hypothetical protein
MENGGKRLDMLLISAAASYLPLFVLNSFIPVSLSKNQELECGAIIKKCM